MIKKKSENTANKKETDAVTLYMAKLKHPLKPEIETVRKIIKASSTKLSERIKWNAPSYYYIEDLVTFNLHNVKRVCLVFHHKSIVTITSDKLLGEYKDRRLMFFNTMNEVKTGRKELERIMKLLVKIMDVQ